jgi:hypothetical protein
MRDARWNGRLTYPRNVLSHRPATPSWKAELPKRIKFNQNKLISSVYAKAASSKTRDGKYVLKYQEPEKDEKPSAKQGFPKLIPRFCTKQDRESSEPEVCIH